MIKRDLGRTMSAQATTQVAAAHSVSTARPPAAGRLMPEGFLPGTLMLPAIAVWIASSSSRSFGLPQIAGIPQLTLQRIVLSLVVLYALASIALRRPRLGPIGWSEASLWVVVSYAGFAGFSFGSFEADPGSKEYLTSSLFFPAIVYSLLLRTRLTEMDVVRFAVILTLFGLYLGITAILERSPFTWAVFPSAIVDPGQGIHFGRSRGPFLQAAINGTVIVQLLPVALLLVGLSFQQHRILGAACAVLLCVGAYLTHTRASLLSLGVVLISGAVLPSLGRRRYVALLLPLALCGAVWAGSGHAVIPRMDESQPIRDRLSLLIATGEMIAAHPMQGVGFGDFEQVQRQYYVSGAAFGAVAFAKELWEGGSHNTLLTPLAEMGLLIGGLYLVLLFRIPLISFRSRVPVARGSVRHPVAVCGGLVGLAFLVNAVFVELRFSLTANALLWTFAALAERCRNAEPSALVPPHRAGSSSAR